MQGETDGRKPAWSSKTVAVNVGAPIVLQSAVELFPQIGPWIAAHPQTLVLAMAGINIAVRHFTAGGLSYGGRKDSQA